MTFGPYAISVIGQINQAQNAFLKTAFLNGGLFVDKAGRLSVPHSVICENVTISKWLQLMLKKYSTKNNDWIFVLQPVPSIKITIPDWKQWYVAT